MSSVNARPGTQLAKGCFGTTLGCTLFLIPLALILGLAAYAIVSTVVDGGHAQKACTTASCANNNNGGNGGSSGGDGGDDGGDGGGDGGGGD